MPTVFGLLLLVLLSGFKVSRGLRENQTEECDCGYGGLCLDDEDDELLLTNCGMCSKVSSGFYRSDCSTIVNHCQVDECERGTCVPTFGGYFCKCPPGFFGRRCEIDIENTQLSSAFRIEVYVNYQVQPGPDGRQTFTIALNEDFPVHEIRSFPLSTLTLVVEMTNGPTYFPKFGSQWTLREVKKECLEEAEEHPDLKDVRVCKYIPAGKLWAYSFDPAIIDIGEEDDLLDILEISDTVGITGKVTFGIFREPPGKKVQPLYLQNYTIFTYLIQRIPHNCVIPLNFAGCSRSKNEAPSYNRASDIYISVATTHKSCMGGLIIRSNWFRQSLHYYKDIIHYMAAENRTVGWEMDSEPEVIPDASRNGVMLKSMSCTNGLVMLAYVLVIRGNPPFYGGTKTFYMSTPCWINIVPGPLKIQVGGGSNRNMPCYAPLNLNLVSVNPSIPVTEVNIKVSCNHTDDEECDPSILEIPVLKKLVTPCGKYYKFDIMVSNAAPGYKGYQQLEVIIFFSPLDEVIEIECISNCKSIYDPWESLLIAHTVPYDRNPVKWEVLFQNHDVAERSYRVHAFTPLTASRILFLPSYSFKTANGFFDPVKFRVAMEGGAYSEEDGILDNLKAACDNYKFSSTPDGRLAIKIGDAMKNYPFQPLSYEILEVHRQSRDALVIFDTDHIERLKFLPNTNSVQLCIKNGWLTRVCCAPQYTWLKKRPPMYSLEALKYILFTQQTRQFLVAANMRLYNDLTSAKRSSFQWTLKVSYRASVVTLFEYVPRESIVWSDVDSTLFILHKLFYTELGNRLLQIPSFKDEKLEKVGDLMRWMIYRYLTMRLFEVTLQAAIPISTSLDWNNIEVTMQRIYHGLTLMILGEHFANQSLHQFDPVVNDYAFSEFQELRIHQNTKLQGIIGACIELFVLRLPMYYDLHRFGQSEVETWVIKTSYEELLYRLNRSQATYQERAYKHIFGPSGADSRWRHYVELQLPQRILDFTSKELTFAATLIKPKLRDEDAAPTLVLNLNTKIGSVINFTNNTPYYVGLPIYNTGSSWQDFSMSLHDYLFRRTTREDHFVVYKVTLPASFVNYTIEFDSVVTIAYFKMKVSFTAVPTFAETFEEEPKACGNGNKTSRLHCIYHVQAPEGEGDLHKSFYVGLIVRNRGNLRLRFKTTFYICSVTEERHIWARNYVCKVLYDPSINFIPARLSTEEKPLMAHCECNMLGTIAVTKSDVRFSQVLTELRIEEVPVPFPVWKIIMGAWIFFGGLIVTVVSFQNERRRVKKHFLNHLNDNYPGDSYTYILGVYTSCNVLAGTTAKVAIKLEGTNSSSRVHILQSYQSHKLSMGSDVWFVLTTKESLGNIRRLYMWQNYKNLSYWKCSHILIYDVEGTSWLFVEINKWMRIEDSNEESRIWKVNVPHKTHNFERTNELSVSNVKHVWLKELRNKHFLLSLFFLHERSFYSYTEKGSIFLLKELTLVIIAWCIYAYPELLFTIDKIYPLNIHDMTEELSHLLMLTFVLSLLARLVTMPFVYFYRVFYMSRAFQRKCTHPLDNFIGVEMSKIFVRESSRTRSTLHDLRSKKSISSVPRFRTSRAASEFQRMSSTTGNQMVISSWTMRILNKMKFAFLAPCQFHCVNFDSYAFQSNVEDKRKKTRYLAFGTVLILFILFMVGTWRAYLSNNYACYVKASVAACSLRQLYYFWIALIFDTLLLEPAIILILTFLMVFYFKASNREEIFWNLDGRIPPKFYPMDQEKYLSQAVKDYYKPRLTCEIEELRKKDVYRTALKETIFYVSLLGALVLCCTLVHSRNIRLNFITAHSTTKLLSGGGKTAFLGVKNAPALKDVVDHPSARNFMKYYIQWNNKWPNGKLIEPTGKHWVMDRKSRAMGTTDLYMLYMNSESPQLTMYLPLKKFFAYAHGFLTESNSFDTFLQTRSFIIPFVDNVEAGYIQGKSGILYPFRGFSFSFNTEDWLHSYSTYTYTNDIYVVYDEYMLLRAMIATSNFINVNLPMVTSVDLIIEYLPSGVVLPKLDVRTHSQVFDNELIGLYLVCMVIIIFGILAYNIIGVSEEGWIIFLKTPQLIIRFVLLLTSVSLLITYVRQQVARSEVADRMRFVSTNSVDFHSVTARDKEKTICLVIFLALICLEVGLSMKRLVGITNLDKPFFKCIFPTFKLLIFCTGILCLASLCFVNNSNFNSRFTSFKTKGFSTRSELKLTAAAFILFWVITLKFIGGSFYVQYLNVDDKKSDETRAGKLARCLQNKSSPSKKMRKWTIDRPINDQVVDANQRRTPTPIKETGSPVSDPAQPGNSKFQFLSWLS